MFLIFGLLGSLGQVSNLDQMYYYGAKLADVRGAATFVVDGDSSVEEIARWLFVVVRLLLFAGALYFMWSVRHPGRE
jgi:hypothetical protein